MDRLIFKDKMITLSKKDFKVKGHIKELTHIVQADIAVIIPIFKNGLFLLEKQYRPFLNKYIYEFPAGHIDDGEEPLDAAKRELKEETGYEAERIKFLFKEYASPGSSDRRFHYYVAYVSKRGKTAREELEIMTLEKIDFKELGKWIKKSKIEDHKTISGYLYYKNYVLGI